MIRLATLLAALALFIAAVSAIPNNAESGDAHASVTTAPSGLPMTCPPSYRHPHFRDYPALHRALAPPGVEDLTVCRYAGINAHDPHALIGSRTLFAGDRLHRLVDLLNRLPKPPLSVISCPAEEGRDVVIHLRYRTRPETPIRQELDGCTFTTNGPRNRWAARSPGPRLIALLRRLTAAGE